MTVYILDKPIGEAWTRNEIEHLVAEYGVEIEQIPAKPHRAVAMNAPTGDARPIYMAWRANCTIQEAEYSARFAAEFPDMVRRYDGMPGKLITEMIERMIALANGRLGAVVAELNGVEVSVKDGDVVDERLAWMQAEQERKHQAYIASPEYKESQRLAEIAEKKRAAARAEILSIAPEHMGLKDEDAWKKTVENNSDGYGSGVVRFAEKWARFMEARMATGATVKDCADECSGLADDEGITGFMYGCAVSILSQVWIHGEALRRWHNKTTQLGTEGDAANETGGVLNPALLSIG